MFRQIDADHYEELEKVPSEHGAKTSFLVPSMSLLYVAVGGSDKSKAGLLRYEVVSNKKQCTALGAPLEAATDLLPA